MKKKVFRVVLSLLMFFCVSVCAISSLLFIFIENSEYSYGTDAEAKCATKWLFNNYNSVFGDINNVISYAPNMKDETEEYTNGTYNVTLLTYQNYSKLCSSINEDTNSRKNLLVSVRKIVDRSEIREQVINSDGIEGSDSRDIYSMYDLGFIKISVKDYVNLVKKYGIKNDEGEYVYNYKESEELSKQRVTDDNNYYDLTDEFYTELDSDENESGQEYITMVNSKGNLIIYREGLKYNVNSDEYLYLEYSPDEVDFSKDKYTLESLLTLSSFNFKEFAIYSDYETKEYFSSYEYIKSFNKDSQGLIIKKDNKDVISNIPKADAAEYRLSISIDEKQKEYQLVYGDKSSVYSDSIENLSNYSDFASNSNGKYTIFYGTNNTYQNDVDYLIVKKLNINSDDQNLFLVFSIVSGILAGIIFIVLIAIAGNSKENCTDIENGIDMIYIDILLGIVIGCITIAAVLIEYTSYNKIESETFEKVIKSYASVVSCSFVIGYISFVTLFFSIVRRIKKKTLSKSFFIVVFFRGVKKIFTSIFDRNIKLLDTIKGMNRREVEYVVSFLIYVFVTVIICSSFNSNYVYKDDYGYYYSDNREEVFCIWMVINIIYCVFVYKKAKALNIINEGAKKIAEGDYEHKINCDKLRIADKELAESINNIGNGINAAVDKSVDAAKQSIKDERLKAELITNVSHDIKTPLTSIINYVDLLKGANLTEEQVEHYLDVLGKKALRLKMLTEDLVEASKITTGNIELVRVPLDFKELVIQSLGEYEDKFKLKDLTISSQLTNEDTVIYADGRRTFRIIENLLSNAYKYSLSGTRVYTSLDKVGNKIIFEMKNISEAPLNIDVSELTERFKRGDESRTTQGSGLGLSIAQSLVDMQDGKLELSIDGDLFKVRIEFNEITKEQQDIVEQ